MTPRALLPLLLALTACQVEEWRNADLQLDVLDAQLDTTTLMRVCVDGVGVRDGAVGANRLAYPGLPADGPLTVTVDALDAGDTGQDAIRLGRAGPVTFDGDVLLQATWTPCDTDCEPCRQAGVAVDESATRLLGVRMVDPSDT